jgi:hypothetical protein
MISVAWSIADISAENTEVSSRSLTLNVYRIDRENQPARKVHSNSSSGDSQLLKIIFLSPYTYKVYGLSQTNFSMELDVRQMKC